VVVLSPGSGKLLISKSIPGRTVTLDGRTCSDMGVSGLSLSPDGKRIVVTDNFGAYVWACDLGQELYSYEHFKYQVFCPVWSPDGKYISAYGRSSLSDAAPDEIHVWDADTGQTVARHPDPGAPLSSFPWSFDSRRFAIQRDAGLEVYDFPSELKKSVLEIRPCQHEFVWLPDGRIALMTNIVDELVLRDGGTGRKIGLIGGHVESTRVAPQNYILKCAPDGSQIAMAEGEKFIVLWRLV
jgi:WD40 repeat protein